jgi:hypothetical protein
MNAEGRTHLIIFCSGFSKGAEYGLYFDRDAQSELQFATGKEDAEESGLGVPVDS